MSKKLSFDELPQAVAAILEIIAPKGGAGAGISGLESRMVQVERKLEQILTLIEPHKTDAKKHESGRQKLGKPVVAEPIAETPKPARARRVKSVSEKSSSQVVENPAPDAPKRKAGRPKSVNTLLRELPKDHQLDVQQASELLKRGKNTIYQLITRDKIPFHKDGRKVYFLADELRKWSKEHPARKRAK